MTIVSDLVSRKWWIHGPMWLGIVGILTVSVVALAGDVRPVEEWTAANPATLEELETALENHRGESFTWVSWGASYNQGFRQVLAPIAKKYELKITEDSPISKPKIRAQTETGNITWHALLGLDAGGGIPLGRSGALEELSLSVVDKRDYFEIGKQFPWFAGVGGTWGMVVVYSTDAVKEKWGGREPQTMVDIFDADGFPGDRMFMDQGGSGWKYVVRFAALSDEPRLLETEAGRAQIAKLSDARIDRAFEILEEFRPHVRVWWQNSAECPSAIASGEIDICIVGTGNLASAVESGVHLKPCWSCGAIAVTDWGAITGGLRKQDPHKFELVQLALAWASFPENQLKLAEPVKYGPLTFGGADMLNSAEYDHVRPFLITAADKLDTVIFMDEVWTADVLDQMIEMFNTFLQEGG